MSLAEPDSGRDWHHIGRICNMAALNLTCSFVVGVSIRVFAQGRYLETALADTICLWMGFTIVKRISEAQTKAECAAYVISGVLAYQLAIFVTKSVYHA